MSDKKLFIGVPVYNSIDWQFHMSMSDLRQHNQSNGIIIHEHSGDSLVSRARNAITRTFLESDATHLLFIDSDLVFSLEQIQRIMEHEEDVVGGAYFKKCEGEPLGVWNLLDTVEFKGNGLIEAKYVGTGFLRISRRVFELMIQEFGNDIWYHLDHDRSQKEYDFWRNGVYTFEDKTRRYLSEDWWFCQKWRDIGGRVWLDRGIVCRHSGHALYPLSYQDEKIFKRPSPPMVADALGKPVISPVTGELLTK